MSRRILLVLSLIAIAFAGPALADEADASVERGDAYRREGRFAEAVAEYKTALRLRGEDFSEKPSFRPDGRALTMASRLQREAVRVRLGRPDPR